jgi:hypothetical protein
MLASDINDLTFFPKGTILTFSSTAWGATSAEFKNIWKVCNKANHDADLFVPDLTDKFLRGAESSDFTTALGADSQSVILQKTHLPAHNHDATGLSFSGLNTSGLSATSAGSGHVHSGTGTTNTGSGGHAHTVSGSTNSTDKTLTGRFGLIDDGRGRIGSSGVFSYEAWGGDSWDGDSGSRTIVNMDVTHSHGITGSTSSGEGTHVHDVAVSIPEGGSHSHTISGSITGGSIGGTTANAGSGTAFSVSTLPVYYKVMYIIKVV